MSIEDIADECSDPTRSRSIDALIMRDIEIALTIKEQREIRTAKEVTDGAQA